MIDATETLYYRARYYNPQIGRFISEDKLRFLQGPSFYAYVGNKPMAYKDPLGYESMGVIHPDIVGLPDIEVQSIDVYVFDECPFSITGLQGSSSYCEDTTFHTHPGQRCWRQFGGGAHICFSKNPGSKGCDVHFDSVSPCRCKDSSTGVCKDCFNIDTVLHYLNDVDNRVPRIVAHIPRYGAGH